MSSHPYQKPQQANDCKTRPNLVVKGSLQGDTVRLIYMQGTADELSLPTMQPKSSQTVIQLD